MLPKLIEVYLLRFFHLILKYATFLNSSRNQEINQMARCVLNRCSEFEPFVLGTVIKVSSPGPFSVPFTLTVFTTLVRLVGYRPGAA